MEFEQSNSLLPLIQNTKLKAIFVGGKGGVGKTTCSSSIALQFAKTHPNRKILLISTDPAHNVSDAFGQQFSGDPQLVNGVASSNLFACEVDPAAAMKKELVFFEHGHNNITVETTESNVNSFMDDLKSFIVNLPGIDEAMALSSVLNFMEKEGGESEEEVKNIFDVIIFDTAPTGHTLRLIQLPSVLKMGLEKLTSWKARFATLFSSVTSMLYSDSYKESQQERLKRLELRMQVWLKAVTALTKMFKDVRATQFVAVCNASFLSVYETKRLMSELKVAKIHSEYVIVNMLMPRMLSQLKSTEGNVAENVKKVLDQSGVVDLTISHAVKDAVELCGGVSKMQEHYLKILHEDKSFKLVLLPMLAGEVRGVESLSGFSERLLYLDPKLSVSKEAKEKLQQFSSIDLEIKDSNNYIAETKAKLMNKDVFKEEEEVIPMELDAELIFKKGDRVKIKNLQSKPELNGKIGIICKTDSFKDSGRVGVELEASTKPNSAILLKPANLELAPNENAKPAPAFNMDNVTPEMMSLVQGLLMKPGGIKELMSHRLVTEMKSSGDEQMIQFFTDIETNGIFAGLRYLSNKYVMGKLASVARQIQQESK